MSENAIVVVFPSVFSKNKIKQLMLNIKKILKIKNLEYKKISKDDSVIVINANDPVFASSAINLLFGIKQVVIAKQIDNKFNAVVSEICKIGSNLLLKGEKFLVKVEGISKGYLPKDVELAATSAIIEKTVNMDAKPGTQNNYDKLLYTYLTKSHAYVCIFSDIGLGGIPNNSQNEQALCCIYDELSAISTLETIKEGFLVKIVVCYKTDSELLRLVKILNQIIPRTVQSETNIEFIKINIKGESAQSYLLLLESITEILIRIAKQLKINRISLGVSPLIFPVFFIDKMINQIFKNSIIPITPLSGLDENIFKTAKEIGMGKFLPRIERLSKLKFKEYESMRTKDIVRDALKTQKSILVKIGPNNVHDILDSL